MNNNFEQRKNDVLSKLDKSSIGQWDEKIKALCEKLNSEEDYYTTSSCSGRVLIMVDQDKKAEGLFVWASHQSFDFEGLKSGIDKAMEISENTKFKQDPCILHVACRNLEAAQKLYDKAKAVGWKRSGLISFEKNCVVELNSTEKLEFPLIQDGNLLVDENFLKIIVSESNRKLKKGWKKIETLLKSL